MNFTAAQSQKYYEARIGKEIRKSGASYMARCPFHDDKHASMSFDFNKGTWHCHTEAIGGGMIDFEQKLNGGISKGDAYAAVAALAGLEQNAFGFGSKPEMVFEYRDEQNILLFEVVRSRDQTTGKKRISNRRPVGKSAWEYTLDGTRRVLYRLQEVMSAREVFIVEGEKCVDAVRTAYADMTGESDACERGFTATTNPHGAGKWREEFGPYFAGKKVVLVPDNDQPGRDHMEEVARNVSKYAIAVKWLTLPLDQEKDDIADYLQAHTFGELQQAVARAPYWTPKVTTDLFVDVHEFTRYAPQTVDWRVDRVIEKGTSGFVIALPKSGKSVATCGLALALAAGTDWLELKVSGPTRTALVTREDAPGLTARRLQRIAISMNLDLADPLFATNLLVNSRAQSKDLMLDDDEQLNTLIAAMQQRRIEFCILDVLNNLHTADENDNTEMRQVMTRVQQIRKDVGCQVCIVHHSVKEWDEGKTLSQLARGASAISGFAEFIIGARMVDEKTKTRQMLFETKSAEALDPFYWKIRDYALTGAAALERTQYEPEQKSTRTRAAALVAGGR